MKTFSNLSRYRVAADGSVLNVETQQWLSGSINPDGYVHYRLTDDVGRTTTIGRHRLVAEFHYGPPPTPDSIVNHLNGVKGDDRPDNLEWTTYRGNAEHAGALGLTEKCLPVSTRDVITGEIVHYPSAISVARALGLSKDAILWRLRGGEERVYPEGLQYRIRDNSREWSDVLTSQYGRNKAVLVLDTRNDQVVRFESQLQVATYLGLSSATISTAVGAGDQRLLKGVYLIKLESDMAPWRSVVDPLKESGRTRPVVVIDIENKETVYPSAKECAEAVGLNPTTLNERLKSGGGKVFKDGYRYRYYQLNGPPTR